MVLFIEICKYFPWLNNTKQEIAKNASWLFHHYTLLPGPCSAFWFDINFGNRLYSKEKRRAWTVRECVRTGAVGAHTRRSLGHHLLHPQNLANFDPTILLFEKLNQCTEYFWYKIFTKVQIKHTFCKYLLSGT